MESVYVPRSPEEKRMQRALLQYRKPENRALVEKAYKIAGRFSFGGKVSPKSRAEGGKTAREFKEGGRKTPLKNKKSGGKSSKILYKKPKA